MPKTPVPLFGLAASGKIGGHRRRQKALVAVAPPAPPPPPPEPQLYEHYIINDDGANVAFNVRWLAQTFTVQAGETHTITSIKIKVYRMGTPDIMTVAITAVDGAGKPTGPDLATGTFDGDDLTDAEPGEWIEVAMSEVELEANTQYALVLKDMDPSPGDGVIWRWDQTDGTYPDGIALVSMDSGDSWTSQTTFDFMFEEWGTPA